MPRTTGMFLGSLAAAAEDAAAALGAVAGAAGLAGAWAATMPAEAASIRAKSEDFIAKIGSSRDSQGVYQGKFFNCRRVSLTVHSPAPLHGSHPGMQAQHPASFVRAQPSNP